MIAMRSPRLSFALLLAFLLLFAQQTAVVHALSHFGDNNASQEQQKNLPGEKACEKCAALAQLSGAVASADVVFHTAQLDHHLVHAAVEGVTRTTVVPYHSQAPPTLL